MKIIRTEYKSYIKLKQMIGSIPEEKTNIERDIIWDKKYKTVVFDEKRRTVCLNLLNNETIQDLSPLKELKYLSIIYLGFNQIQDLSPLKDLKHLSIIYLGFNQIQDLSPLKDLKKLTKIYLSNNQIQDLSPLKDLTNLTNIDLSSNQISDLSPLKKLRYLTKIDLSSNLIRDLSPLKELKNLTKINLSSNQISDLSTFNELKNISKLDLGSNQITNIFPLKELKNLKQIYLNDNKINNLLPLMELKNLTRIDLEKNRIKELFEEILDFNLKLKWKDDVEEDGIFLMGNPLEKPSIEIIKQGAKAIKAYFDSLKDKELPLNEVKVLLVGNGGSGKTSLIKRIFSKDYDKNESKTDGIKISDWEIEIGDKKIVVHFWDFGGQEIMHSTHQFFLSKRSLYILVLDNRKEENEEYWLNLIESFGGNSPILIALNKMDENPSFDVNRKFLMKKFPGIKDFIKTSCKTGEGIEELVEKLKKHLLDVEIIETMWPEKWFMVKQRLEKMQNNYISHLEFQSICKEIGISNIEHQNILLEYLHDLGSIVHFPDIELLHTSVLNPVWVTKAVYTIINSNEMAETRGVLSLVDVCKILTPEICPSSKYQFILSLMEKFELCYKIDNKTVLLPDLLDKQEPEFQFNEDEALLFILQYEFLPKSIMPQFIVKMHHDIKNNLQWRTGIVLKNKTYESTAAIKADIKDKKIYVYVSGMQTREYLAIIRGTFDTIHQKFERITFKELITLPDHKDIYIDYNELIAYEKKGIKEIFVGSVGKFYNVQSLLNGVVPKEIRLGKVPHHSKSKIDPTTISIKIFLASSAELNVERKEIDKFISEENKKYQKKNIYFDLVMWEKQNRSFNDARKSNDNIQAMLKCDAVIVLFEKKIGKFTKEEFFKAYENLNQRNKPFFLFVFFKNVGINDMKKDEIKEIINFKSIIEHQEQYYQAFKDMDDLKSILQTQLKQIADLHPDSIIKQLLNKNYDILIQKAIPFHIIYQVEKQIDREKGTHYFFKMINDLCYENNLPELSGIIHDYFYKYIKSI